jgi:hypothetical protein
MAKNKKMMYDELVKPNASVKDESEDMDMEMQSPEEEAAETPEEEAAESDEMQSAEEEAGTEMHSEEDGESDVKVPEQFQKAADSMVYRATKHQLDYLQNCINDRQRELMKAQTKSERSGTFDMEGLPT